MKPDGFIAQCSHCKYFETVWIYEGQRLEQTRKFRQVGNHIFHDCGSKEPCLLVPAWKKKSWWPGQIFESKKEGGE